jgi:hypothetical protein
MYMLKVNHGEIIIFWYNRRAKLKNQEMHWKRFERAPSQSQHSKMFQTTMIHNQRWTVVTCETLLSRIRLNFILSKTNKELNFYLKSY